jgi:YfiH family protein
MIQLRAANLSRLPSIAHGFFGRTGGVSEGIFSSLNCGPGAADQRPNVLENRRRVAQALGSNSELVTLGQVHGTRAITVMKPWPIGKNAQDDPKLIPLGDAMATNVPGIALGILAADCAPVLFADSEAQVVGAAHAGWRGALDGVIESAIEAMESLGAKRDRMTAAIGPCIGKAAYEVGSEFHARFLQSDPTTEQFFDSGNRAGHFQFDLAALVASRLDAALIHDIWRASVCTYSDESAFFSYRRATHRGESDYGRQVSAILLCK